MHGLPARLILDLFAPAPFIKAGESRLNQVRDEVVSSA